MMSPPDDGNSLVERVALQRLAERLMSV